MEAGQARSDQIDSRIAGAVGDPDLAVRGTQAIREVMVATEVEVASMLARVDGEVASLMAAADAGARTRVSERREQLAGVRHELALWAAAVAVGFENLLGLLDEADARMAAPEAPAAAPGPGEAPAAAPGPPEAPAAQPVAPQAEGPSRPRWWRRWFRRAA